MQTENEKIVTDKIIAAVNSIREPSDKFKAQLIFFINELINTNFNALIQLLYRLDINEKKLKEVLKNNEQHDAGILISELIIQRQLQKIKSRKQFNKTHPENNNEDKW